MHEMAITQSVIDAVCEHSSGRRVHEVTVEVGALCAVEPDAMSFCFSLAAEGTVAEGAVLHLVITPGRARCRRCGAEAVLHDFILLCGCGSADLDVISGRELLIKSMEVSDECAQPADAATLRDR
ncbi:hydrogenase maturation nickel metallochaperone HypA/HybF [Gordonia rhizosphera]|uniref:Hydrogenase maturation factor HypA n=1 Tax=Gordonia rhizosphera NBRC 16068 TaxID=1108045 RepID=K6VWW5_9ACTN|nr:hydrogenase maturation nickel metallochaperone HypA [Gordonia rhizosphera]GAB91390.1 NiFe-hydrogenase nickel incorporation protein HypA [Gordonia rhizosphera NBRC 16068]